LNASELQAYVSEWVKHDYEHEPTTLDPEQILREGRGRCGQRAAVFQYLAKQNGLDSRIVCYRGHVCNQVRENGVWKEYDCTIPLHKYHQELLDHIKSGPIFSYSSEPDYVNHFTAQNWQAGEYTTWLGILQNSGVNFLLPRDILHGKPLDATRPNVIIRHDICHLTPESRQAWMGMVHEENQLGLRSASYLPVEALEHVPLFEMFEHEGFEIGLHSTAIIAHDITFDDVMARFERQMSDMMQTFKIDTTQAHGYDDKHGLPKVTYTQLDEQIPYSFRNLVDLNPAYGGRVADSMGVMTPPLTALDNLQPGKLYYILWHPEYYEVRGGWVNYFGLMQDGNLEGNLPKLNRIIKDTPYFNDIAKPHLLTVAKIVTEQVKEGLVLDLAAGWGILGLLIPQNLRYIAVDNEYKRMKASQALYQSLFRPLPDFRCVDYESTTLPQAECVVLIGWEGDLHRKPDFQKLADLVKPDGVLIISFINSPRTTYTDISPTEMQTNLSGFRILQTLTPQTGFPREMIVARKVNKSEV